MRAQRPRVGLALVRTLSEEERRSRATAEAEAAVADHATAALDAELERVQQQAAEATTHLDVERVSARPASQPASQLCTTPH